MTALADNPAVNDPKKTLNVSERRALFAIRDYRRQVALLAGVMIGPHRFGGGVIRRLELHGLVRGQAPHLTLTEAGQLAADRLRSTERNLSPKAQARTGVADRSAPRPEDSAATIREDR